MPRPDRTVNRLVAVALTVLLASFLLADAPAYAQATTSGVRNCWQEAGETYQISPWLLYAIAQAESDLNPKAVNRSHVQRTGTYDIGLMQINSSHLRQGAPLAKAGWTERDLYEPCKNVHVGAWLLAENIRRFGAKWDAVGAYNAVCSQLKGEACTKARKQYIQRVWTKLTRSAQASAQATATSAPAPRVIVEETVLPLRIGGRG